MIHYEVTLECSDATAPELERWMRNTHIPDVIATGCFVATHFDRADSRFRSVYQAVNREEFDRYLNEHAERLRAVFRQRFPDGVAVSREIWEQLQGWPAV